MNKINANFKRTYQIKTLTHKQMYMTIEMISNILNIT